MLGCCALWASAQRAEYWLDNDPGRGRGVAMSVVGEDVSASVSTASLSPGLHLLGVRAAIGKSWGQTYTHAFFVMPSGGVTTLSGAEWWIDDDPGCGAANSVAVSAGAKDLTLPVSVAGLPAGMHTFGARLKQGKAWGQTYTHSFIVLPSLGETNLTGAEWWIDEDPGHNKANSVAASAGATELTLPVTTAGLLPGIHTVGARLRQGNSWGQTYTHTFVVLPSMGETNLTGAEWWIDDDPGHSKANSVAISAGATELTLPVTTAGLTPGMHTVGARLRQGNSWGQTYTHTFVVLPTQGETNLTGAEYWLDDDPGFGQATAIAVSAGATELTLPVNTPALAEGTHLIGIRLKQGSSWGQTYTHAFFVLPSTAFAMQIQIVEAYWDYDLEHSINIPFTQVGDSVVLTNYPLSTDALSFGPHVLNLRAKADGKWSILTSYEVCKNAVPMFEFLEESACVGDEVIILDASTDVQPETTYKWDVDGDGKTDYTDKGDIVHTFTKAGKYTVTLTVQTGDGCESSYSQDIYIHPTSAPSVSLKRSKSSSCAGEVVTFTATPTNGGEHPTFTWLRNGTAIDGQSNETLELSDLTNNETIQVQLTTDNPCSATKTAISSVLKQTVYDLPEAQITLADTYFTDEKAFTLSSYGTPSGGTFYINGEVAKLFNPKTNEPGEYTVRYMVKNSNGCEGEAEMTFTLKVRSDATLTVLSSDETMGSVSGGGTFKEGSKVTISATASEGHHFVQWQDGNTDATREITLTGDVTYTATFAANTYTVTFVDEDGTTVLLAAAEYAYGATPTKPADPSKPATAQYTYTFAGWSPEVTTVTENVTYKATYTSTVNKYKVTFVDEDGTTVLASDEYEYGATPTPPADPSKAETGEYTYTFAGWTPEIAAVTEAATYTATYTATHLVVPTELSLTSAGYNTTDNVVLCVNFTGDATVCNDIMLAGTYNSWSTAIAEMSKFTPLAGFDGWYAVEFPYVVTQDGFGNEIYPQGKPVELDNEGAFGWDNQCGDPDAWTHKGGDYADITWGFDYEANIAYYSAGAYIYEMSYWKKHINPCAEIIRHDYTINLYAPDACEEMRPAVAGDFNNWNYGVPMSEQIDESQRTFYTVTINAKEGQGFKIREVNADDWVNQLQYKNENGEWSNFDNLPLGTDEVITLDWSDNEKYRYASCIPPVTYTVTWLNDDGTVLETDAKVKEGATPEYNGEMPTKDATAQYTYTFAGWTPEVTTVTEDVTYTASYSSTVNTYEITFAVKDNPALSYTVPNIPYGTTIGSLIEIAKTALGGDTFEDEMYVYTFAGVEDTELTDIVTESTTYYILYTKEEKTHTSISNVESATPVQKIIRDDKVFILRDGKIYTVQGVEVK